MGSRLVSFGRFQRVARRMSFPFFSYFVDFSKIGFRRLSSEKKPNSLRGELSERRSEILEIEGRATEISRRKINKI
jgi:hypothetical protein